MNLLTVSLVISGVALVLFFILFGAALLIKEDIKKDSAKILGEWYDSRGNLVIIVDKETINMVRVNTVFKYILYPGVKIALWVDPLPRDEIKYSIRHEKLYIYFPSTGESTILYRKPKEE